MRIKIISSARQHGITPAEIRSVMSYPAIRVKIKPRRPGAVPFLFMGPAADNEPYIEVIADLADASVSVVFHAMMLRPATTKNLGLGHLISKDKYGTQRK